MFEINPQFAPPFYLKDSVGQSFLGAFMPFFASLPSKRELIQLDPTSEDRFEYFHTPPPPADKKHYILVLHAWLGSAHTPYVKDMALQAHKAGFGVIRIHQRDHGSNEKLTNAPFHTARHAEVARLIQAIVQKHNIESYSLVGFSIGGSISLRVISLEKDPKLKSAVIISPYINLQDTLKRIDSTSFLQSKFLYAGLLLQIYKKVRSHPDRYNVDFLKGTPRNCHDTVFKLTTHHYGFSSPQNYFGASDLRNFPLSSIEVPTLIISSKDDPISDIQNFKDIKWSASTQIHWTEHGGHVGFLNKSTLPSGSKRWSQYQAVKFIKKSLSL